MAIVDNFWLKGQKKKLGGSVIYQAMGQTRQRALATSIANPRTQAQMNQRVKWANLVNLYRANQSWMKYAFETKKATQSDYNKFMSLNVTNSNIFLTKDIAAAGGCVVQAYLITQGSLPSIETTYDDDEEWWATNIYLGNGYIFSTPTVAGFTAALLENNPAMREGDQLSFIRMTQMTNADNGAPYVIVRKYEVILNLSNNASIWDYLPNDYIDSSEAPTNAQLVVKNSSAAGGFVLILSRTTGGKTFVSSQRIVVANNSPIIDAYSSAAALQAAIDSYGESEDAFLSSVTANQLDNTFVPVSVIRVSVGSVFYTPGQSWVISKSDAGLALTIRLSAQVPFTATGINIDYYEDGVMQRLGIGEVTAAGTDISATLPPASGLPTRGVVVGLTITSDGGSVISASFVVRNEDTIPGLE